MRRKTSTTQVGELRIGSNYPIRVQSMANTNTNDIDASVSQAKRMIKAGAELIRFTTQGSHEVESIGLIHDRLSSHIPLVADIHFNADIADLAAEKVEKVRINPGNYIDPARKFLHIEYTNEAYQEELQKLRERFVRFLAICRQHHTAIRIGVNHGSLSDRIMSRYGDTPAGMVESCMEFLRICVEENFYDVIVSIKASTTRAMVETVRLLVQTMDKEQMFFPIHLGVTEAGEGEDGRIRSAVGIGALLWEGIGDTIRVSLSEPPENEIPVAKELIHWTTEAPADSLRTIRKTNDEIIYSSKEDCDFSTFALHAAADLGRTMWENKDKTLRIENTHFTSEQLDRLTKDILQAAGLIRYKTEYISCPGCGRTLFDLQEGIRKVRAATAEFTGLKIAVMGCIVNGPGEMNDADYGYVGAGRGKVSIYRRKDCIFKNIPEEEAVEQLVGLIKKEQNYK